MTKTEQLDAIMEKAESANMETSTDTDAAIAELADAIRLLVVYLRKEVSET